MEESNDFLQPCRNFPVVDEACKRMVEQQHYIVLGTPKLQNRLKMMAKILKSKSQLTFAKFVAVNKLFWREKEFSIDDDCIF